MTMFVDVQLLFVKMSQWSYGEVKEGGVHFQQTCAANSKTSKEDRACTIANCFAIFLVKQIHHTPPLYAYYLAVGLSQLRGLGTSHIRRGLS